MKKQNITKISSLVAAVAMGMGASTSASAALVDLTTADTSGVINGATFQQVSLQTTGTGVIQPFLRLQANGSEAAYNTSGNLPNTFDQSGGPWNQDLLLSSIPIVNGSYQFLLDINQSNDPLLTLNQLQIFSTDTAGQIGGTLDANNRISGLITTTTIYDMNSAGAPTANSVLLNYALNPGSGGGDMFLYIPASAFVGAGDYIILYSHFGLPGEHSNNGFEEWATLSPTTATPVPEPTTVIAGMLLLLPFATSTLRMVRKNRTA
jgi:hypothetical protein